VRATLIQLWTGAGGSGPTVGYHKVNVNGRTVEDACIDEKA
jgi:hypothetical protein